MTANASGIPMSKNETGFPPDEYRAILLQWWVRIERAQLLQELDLSFNQWKNARGLEKRGALKEYSEMMFRILSFHQDSILSDPGDEWQKIEIEKNIRIFNEYRKKEYNGVRWESVDFSSRDLSGYFLESVNFNRVNCQGADLSGSNSKNSTFNNSVCSNTNFSYANLRFVHFRESNCERADFTGAECQYTDFYTAVCRKAIFVGAMCEGANFMRTDLLNAKFKEAFCAGGNFYSAHCENTIFTEARCEGANFRGAYCGTADFTSTNCKGSNFSYADLRSTALNAETDISGCRFYNTKIEGSDIKYAKNSLFDAHGKIKPFPEEEEANAEKNRYKRREKLEVAQMIYNKFTTYFSNCSGYGKEQMAFALKEGEIAAKLSRYYPQSDSDR